MKEVEYYYETLDDAERLARAVKLTAVIGELERLESEAKAAAKEFARKREDLAHTEYRLREEVSSGKERRSRQVEIFEGEDPPTQMRTKKSPRRDGGDAA
jgi:hypothetical protein